MVYLLQVLVVNFTCTHPLHTALEAHTSRRVWLTSISDLIGWRRVMTSPRSLSDLKDRQVETASTETAGLTIVLAN